MTAERPETASIFCDEDRLRLLQLQTRRTLAESRHRARRRDDEESGAEAATEDISERVGVPDRWRLVPEGTSLYAWQKECLPLWLSEGRGTVKVATGGGKTLFALAAAERLQNEREPDLRTVVVVPTIPLMFQWFDEMQRGNLPASAIGLMGGGQDVPPVVDLRVLICVLAGARERLPEFVTKAGWSSRMLLVVDECHRANAQKARNIFDTRPRYALGLSATPEQELETEGMPSDEAYEASPVGQALGPIIYEFTLKQSLEAGLLTPFEIWHIGLSLSGPEGSEHARLSREITDLRKGLQIRHRTSRSNQSFLAWCQTQATHGGSASAEAQRFIGLSNGRKRLLYRAAARTEIALGILAESVRDPDGRAIVFHESIDEIERLFVDALDAGLPAVLEHSRLPEGLRGENIDAFRRGIARVIISAKSLVEGFNVPSADLGIIAASSGSVRQRIQSLGRMLRRKPGGRTARIAVLYVRDTEDEAIYERADWENVVGAERNRYFHWQQGEPGSAWTAGLTDISKPPRVYRPTSWEIDVTTLATGDAYPAQATGLDLKVDSSGSLRTEDGALVTAERGLVDAVLAHNQYRRARRTPAGHLIARVDSKGSQEEDWRFLGTVDPPTEPGADNVIRFRLKRSAGRREIAREDDHRKGLIQFALGPRTSHTPEAGDARDRLLAWAREVEQKWGTEAKELYWDGVSQYWLEMRGERIRYDGALPPLEFDR